jgi:hypothetical protein
MATKIPILDGSTASDPIGNQVLYALKDALHSPDQEVEHPVLRETAIDEVRRGKIAA